MSYYSDQTLKLDVDTRLMTVSGLNLRANTLISLHSLHIRV